MERPVNTTDVEATDGTSDAAEAVSEPFVGQDPESLMAELETARQEATENYDRYLRVHAEMDNYKKRIERTYAELARSTKKDLLLKLLNVKDNLERALAYGASTQPGEDGSVIQGVRLTEYQLDQVLRGEGVTPMDLRSQPFDPQVAEAINTVVDPRLPDHSVAEVVQQGYLYLDDVLRPAKVIVAVKEQGEEL
ncbi:MAG TPA: nucleotide exchange factor GrpE [Chloroflexota bacterium]|jgi:molecular chaperone GrpE|nr:nucleotide exchange factor GrpE [Chloroflexota bacterium]